MTHETPISSPISPPARPDEKERARHREILAGALSGFEQFLPFAYNLHDGKETTFCKAALDAMATLAAETQKKAQQGKIEQLQKVADAARLLTVSPYPAHGSGMVLRVTQDSLNDLMDAVASLDGKKTA